MLQEGTSNRPLLDQSNSHLLRPEDLQQLGHDIGYEPLMTGRSYTNQRDNSNPPTPISKEVVDLHKRLEETLLEVGRLKVKNEVLEGVSECLHEMMRRKTAEQNAMLRTLKLLQANQKHRNPQDHASTTSLDTDEQTSMAADCAKQSRKKDQMRADKFDWHLSRRKRPFIKNTSPRTKRFYLASLKKPNETPAKSALKNCSANGAVITSGGSWLSLDDRPIRHVHFAEQAVHIGF